MYSSTMRLTNMLAVDVYTDVSDVGGVFQDSKHPGGFPRLAVGAGNTFCIQAIADFPGAQSPGVKLKDSLDYLRL